MINQDNKYQSTPKNSTPSHDASAQTQNGLADAQDLGASPRKLLYTQEEAREVLQICMNVLLRAMREDPTKIYWHSKEIERLRSLGNQVD